MPETGRAVGNSEDLFVNPYTFVPFAEPRGEGFRGAPGGHDGLGEGRYLGDIEVRLTTLAPLLLRGVSREDAQGEFPRRELANGQRVPFIPGSSLAGVTRSMFEMIAGGCLRVFDDGFVPGYRDQAVAHSPDWTLTRVGSTDGTGRPTGLQLCDPVVWVPAPELAEVLGGPDKVVTGATVEVLRWQKHSFGGGVERLEANDAGAVRAGDDWVVLVTDAKARKERKSYFCAVGRLSRDAGATVTVTDGAWADYLTSVEGTDDVRRARTERTLRLDAPVEAEVFYPFANGKRLVGKRHEARPRLFEGQVLWARVERVSRPVSGKNMTFTEVTGLALSAIWRHPGVRVRTRDRDTAGERVPPALLPCRDPADLCPACRVFGSVDAEGTEGTDGRAEQRSYRGHVRFSDALPQGDAPTRTFHLAPLGAPRPGAGQFYLESGKGGKAAPGRPLREWGSAADNGEPRRLNGRKQYWLTARHQDRPLFRVTDGPFDGEMAATAEAVLQQSVFTYTVRFDGLTKAEIGGLLAALSPARVLDGLVPHADGGADIGIAVGGGRPFGFGACTTRITGLRVDDARSRYLGARRPALEVENALQAFTEAVDDGVRETWPALAAALHLDHVDPGKVWYPPARPIPGGPLRKDDLEPGFEFWKQTRGLQHAHGADPLLPLPKAADADQELPVFRKDTRRRTGPPGGQPGKSSDERRGR
ncbi:MAG: CRISPR-associated family protein [Actinomycetia bacterium]|nr:CRISPR-associated family protein [Actinomycetes bacterium]